MSTPSTLQAPTTHSLRVGAGLMVLAALGYATMGALVKSASEELSVWALICARGIVICSLVGAMIRRKAIPFRIHSTRLMAGRCLLGLAALGLYFFSLSTIPLANAVTLQYTNPIFVALFSGVALGERLSAFGWCCVVLAFGGASLLLAPDQVRIELGAVAGLGSALLAALAYLCVRALRKSDSPEMIVFCFSATTVLVMAPLCWHELLSVTAPQALMLLAIGCSATVGQLAMTWAYRYATAPFVSAFSYTTVLFGWFYGTVWFADPITASAIAGAVIVGFSGVLLARSPRQSTDRSPA